MSEGERQAMSARPYTKAAVGAGALDEERRIIADKAREWAGHYTCGSDGMNTFVLLAEWIEARMDRLSAPSSDMAETEDAAKELGSQNAEKLRSALAAMPSPSALRARAEATATIEEALREARIWILHECGDCTAELILRTIDRALSHTGGGKEGA